MPLILSRWAKSLKSGEHIKSFSDNILENLSKNTNFDLLV